MFLVAWLKGGIWFLFSSDKKPWFSVNLMTQRVYFSQLFYNNFGVGHSFIFFRLHSIYFLISFFFFFPLEVLVPLTCPPLSMPQSHTLNHHQASCTLASVTQPGLPYQGAASQTLRCRGLQQRDALFIRQPREESGYKSQVHLPKARGSGDFMG